MCIDLNSNRRKRNIEKGSKDIFEKQNFNQNIHRDILQPPLKEPSKFFDKLKISVFFFFIRLFVWKLTHNWEKLPNKSPKKFTNQQINNHYTKIATKYEERHHKITNSRDIWWRRQIGFDAATALQHIGIISHMPILIDLCTGTGLSLEEILKVFKLKGIRVKAYGLDCNKEMLEIANEKTYTRMKDTKLLIDSERETEYVLGNAMNLVFDGTKDDECFHFNINSVDCITILCGIGGIENPILSFEQQLKVLRPGGIIIMFDMHRPEPDLSTHWPFFSHRLWPILEKKSWEEITLKLVLRKLWAWSDPTEAFDILPLISYHDTGKGKYFGFEIILSELNNEPWFFKFPAMYTAKIIVKKVEIIYSEHAKRTKELKKFCKEYTKLLFQKNK